MSRKKLVDAHTVQKTFDLTPNELKAMVKKGLPVEVPGRPGVPPKYVIEDVQKWLDDFDEDDPSGESDELKKARIRKLELEIARREHELEVLRLRYVKVEDVLPVVERVFSGVKSALLMIPSQLGPLLVGSTDKYAAEGILLDGINKVLAQLNEAAVSATVVEQNNRGQQ